MTPIRMVAAHDGERVDVMPCPVVRCWLMDAKQEARVGSGEEQPGSLGKPGAGPLC